MNNKIKGYIYGAIAAATYGMNPLFALPLYQDGFNTDSVLFFRYLFAIPLLGIMIYARGRNFKLQNLKEISILVIMGMLMALSSLTLFKSYTYIDVGIASTLLFVYPILVALIMWIFFKEKISALTTTCIVLASIGISLLFKGKDGSIINLTGVFLVFASSLAYAIYLVAINQKNLKNIPTLKITFYVLLFGIVFFAFKLVLSNSICLPTKTSHWINLFGLGFFPTTISLLFTTKAIQYIGSTPTAILGAIEPVTALFFGIIVFGETLIYREMIGIVLIIVSVSIIVVSGNIQLYLVRFRKMFPRLRLKK